MGEASIWRAFAPRTRPVSAAVNVRAQKRSAALHFFRNLRLVRIETRVGSDGIFVRASRVIIRTVPIGAPFPDVARHVVQSVTVGRKRRDRSEENTSELQ